MTSGTASRVTETLAARIRRRLNRRLMPFLCVLSVNAYMDRVNVGFAGLRMTRELGFSDAVFGFFPALLVLAARGYASGLPVLER